MSDVEKENLPEEAPVTKPRAGKHLNIVSRLQKIIHTRAFLVVVLFILILAPSAYFYKKSQDAERKLNNPSEVNKQVVDDFEKKVGRHILLPTDEQPTLVTVTDVEKVRGQQFFDNAENGDKALVYTQARKAILYRPSKDIVIEVAPLNIDAIQPQATN